MDRTRPDALLTVARVVTWIFIAALAVAAVALLVAIPAVLIGQDRIVAELASKGATAGSEIIGAILLVLVGVEALVVLAIWFLRLQLRIIASVGEGDPFAPINAERLNRMAWLSLAGYLASLPVGGLTLYLAKEVPEKVAHVRGDIDLGGSLLLSLVLFILARVFRHGAAMREDLEGTV